MPMVRFRLPLLALALFAAQIAPAIHGLCPHDDQRPHCTDHETTTHVERHTIDHEDDDCAVCLNAAGGSMLVDAGATPVAAVSLPEIRVIDATLPVAIPYSHPDSRGPPSVPA